MAIKDVQLGMAEDLPEETRIKFGLPEKGLVVIETTNPNLKIDIKPIADLKEYFLESGSFLE